MNKSRSADAERKMMVTIFDLMEEKQIGQIFIDCSAGEK